MKAGKNVENEKNLLMAARKGDLSECQRLVIDQQTDINIRETENEIGWSPLLLASRGGHLDVASFFLRNGADVNGLSTSKQSALHTACWNGHEAVAALLISHGAASTHKIDSDRHLCIGHVIMDIHQLSNCYFAMEQIPIFGMTWAIRPWIRPCRCDGKQLLIYYKSTCDMIPMIS